MKPLLPCVFLLLILAWVPYGVAGEPPCQTYDPVTRTTVNTCLGDPDAYDRSMLDLAGNARVSIAWSDCAAKMESAMKAMEPYTVVGREFRFINLGGRRLLEIYLADKPIPDKPGIDEASKLWDAAKKECWRTP